MDMTTANPSDVQGPAVSDGASLLEQIIVAGRYDRHPGGRVEAEQTLVELLGELEGGRFAFDGDLERSILTHIAAIDRALTAQINEILHHEAFQRLEGTWRGLHRLVHAAETGERLRIRALNATKEELAKDLLRAVEFDQSALFKGIYEAEYGTFGGAPFGLIVGDYEFTTSPRDCQMLTQLAGVMACAHAPFVAAASPEMFNLESFTDLDQPRDLAKVMDGSAYVDWKALRRREDSRYLVLTLPRFLGRLPYGAAGQPVEAFDFEEEVDGRDHRRYLWSNSAFLLGERIVDAFARYGWTTAIRGVEGGGLVEGLPTHRFKSGQGELALKEPTEIDITDRREKELSDLGFLPLVHCKGESYAAFFGAQTLNQPARYVDDDATANAELSARLPYILAVSRIAHYLKAIVRDKVGGFQTREGIQQYLERWISQYVLLSDNANPGQKAKRPLREAQIVVEEIPGEPGAYRAVAHLRPHFQLEAVNVSLRLVANLPPSAR